MATVRLEKRYKKSYTIIIDYGLDPVTQKRKTETRSIETTDPAVAEAEMLEIKKQLTLGTHKSASKVTVGEYFKQWFNTDVAKELETNTRERYRQCAELRIIPWIGHIRLCDLKRSDLMAFYKRILEIGHLDNLLPEERRGNRKPGWRPVGSTTLEHHHRFIRRVLNHAIYEDEILDKNVALRMSLPAPPKDKGFDDEGEVRVFSEDEVVKLEEAVKNTLYDNLIAVALRTGMRREELLGLTWDCVNWKKPSIVVKQALIRTTQKGYEIKRPKNSKKREIEITPDVVEALRSEQRKQEVLKTRLKGAGIDNDGSTFDLYDTAKNLVFARQDGYYLYPDTISHWLPAICEKIGITRLGFHSLRHTHASHLLAAGEDISYVSKRLGHSSLEITFQIYFHFIPQEKRKALAELDKRFSKQSKTEQKRGK